MLNKARLFETMENTNKPQTSLLIYEYAHEQIRKATKK